MLFFGAFIVSVIIQCIYALYFLSGLRKLRGKVAIVKTKGGKVSVIICAKNEAEQLKKNLPFVLGQDYGGEYEVVVVNDASTDNTDEVLREIAAMYDHMKVVTVTASEIKSLKGKKYALSKGVEAASNEWLLLTDADCRPASNRWLQLMTASLANGKELIAGYGGYSRRLGLLNAFIRWETIHTFLQYSSYALAGRPYMAVGRNMACTKAVFHKAAKSEAWNKLPSGDDDLLISVCATRENMAVVVDERAFTHSEAKGSWKEWAGQKERHLSTGKYYKTDIKVLLGLYGIAHLVFWILAGFLLCSEWWLPSLLLFGLRCTLFWFLWWVTAQKLKEKVWIYLFPVFDIGWMIYNFAFSPFIIWKNKQNWK